MRLLIRFIAITSLAVAGLVGSATAIGPQVTKLFSASHGVADTIDLNPLPERSLIFDRYGNLMATLHAEENRSPVKLTAVPQPVIDTILAVEDEGFYDHKGVNVRSTLRALLENVSSGGIEQGGSTITQQVVKNALLSPAQDLERKTREAVLAWRLEQTMTKNDILERYLNTVYFGNGTYGLQAAGELYFGKNVDQLDWGDAALLAALIRNPTGYDPFKYPDLALERRRLALDRVVETGHLTKDEADLYAFRPLPTAPVSVLPPPKDYFVEQVKLQLLHDPRLGETDGERYNAVFKGGLRIYTTFDPIMQINAVVARNEQLPGDNGQFHIPATSTLCRDPKFGCLNDGRTNYVLGTAVVVSLEPNTGAIRAMVGGPGFDNYPYNIATDGIGRQAGSSFKTFVLSTLMQNGYVPSDQVDGHGPCTFPNPGGEPDPYTVENFGNSGGGPGTILSQTLRSSNCAYVRLGQVVGLQRVIDLAKKMGITSPLSPQLSLPIGAFEVRPLDMASAYGVIAAEGIRNEPYYIDHVDNSAGTVLFAHEAHPERVMSVQSARLVEQVLEQNVLGGTGTRARLPGRPAAGKTGTAQDSADAWFVGFTPQLSTAVWMGAPVGRVPMRNVGGIAVTGGSYPARIWGQYMAAVLEGQPVFDFIGPDHTRAGKLLALDKEQEITTTTTAPSTTSTTGGPPTTRHGHHDDTTTTEPPKTTTTRAP